MVEWLGAGLPVMSNLALTALPYTILKKRWGEFVLLDDEDFLGVDPVLDADGNQSFESEGSEGKSKLVPKHKLKLLRKLAAVCERNPGKHLLVMIDEAPNYYPAQDWKGNPKALKAFLKQHRHMNVSVVAVAQNHAMLDNHFTRLCQEFRHHENLVKNSSLEMVLWWFGDNFHRAYSCANAGGKPFTKEKFSRKFFRITKQKAVVYSTVQMHASDMPGRLRKARGKSLRLVGLAFFLTIIIGVFVVAAKLYFGSPAPIAKPVVKTAAAEVHHAVLVSFESVGQHQVICEYDNGVKICEPFTVERAYQLADLVGQSVVVPQLPKSTFGKVLLSNRPD